MHARVTRYKMHADKLDDAVALMHDLKADILAMPGMLHFINVADDEGNGYVVAIVESRETSEANRERTMAMWGRFSDHLEVQPEIEGFNVHANWPG